MTHLQFSQKFLDGTGVIDYTKLHASKNTNFSSELPFHIPQLIQVIRTGNKYLKSNIRLLDATAHVGGFSLPWAATFPKDKITAVEIDPDVVDILKYNVRTLKLKNIKVLNADASAFIMTCAPDSFDVIYLDPPWGGPDYRFKPKLQLYLGKISVPDIIWNIFNTQIANWVFFKAPINYDFASLPFAYTVRTIQNEMGNKRYPDYLLVSLNRAGNYIGGRPKLKRKSTKKKKIKNN